MLSDAELERAESYSNLASRRRFLAAAVLLRTCAGRMLNLDPRHVYVKRDCAICGRAHSKTQLPGTGLQASVTHSGAVVGVALGNGAAIGLDVEYVWEIDYGQLSSLVLAATEPPIRSIEEFFCYWTRKESVVKATGDGLSQSLTRVIVSSPSAPAEVISYGGKAVSATLTDLKPHPGYAAAITVMSRDPVEITSYGIADWGGALHANRRHVGTL